MKVVYFADDGTPFDDEDDCLIYERKQEATVRLTESHFWYRDGRPMSIQEFLNGKAECCDFMEIANNEEAETVHDFLTDEGIPSPWQDWRVDRPSAGQYYWENDEWYNLETEFARFRCIMDVFVDKG